MRPAFDSTRQAAAFALLLLLLLAAPWLAGKTFLPPREQAYASEGWGWAPYPWIQRQIFNETNDIDIVFMGSSHMAFGIDAPYAQQKLSEELCRKAVVRSLTWGGLGYDALYFTARDLMAHRQVKMLVFYDETKFIHPSHEAHHWFRWGDNAAQLTGLPFKCQAYYYFAAVAGMPRNLLEMLTPNLPEATNSPSPNYYEISYHANPETSLGAVIAPLGFDKLCSLRHPFVPFAPNPGASPSEFCVYAPDTAANFAFSSRRLPDWQIFFGRKLGELAKSHGCKLVLLHIPVLDERKSPVISEPCYWPDIFQTDLAMVGIPPQKMFAGLTENEAKLLYADPSHMNQNGQRYFTSLITPALFRLYETLPSH